MSNRNELNPLRLTQAINGFFLEARARGLSKHTISDHRNFFKNKKTGSKMPILIYNKLPPTIKGQKRRKCVLTG